jgi:hypothetical protein
MDERADQFWKRVLAVKTQLDAEYKGSGSFAGIPHPAEFELECHLLYPLSAQLCFTGIPCNAFRTSCKS